MSEDEVTGVGKRVAATEKTPEVVSEDSDAAGLLAGDVDLDYRWSTGRPSGNDFTGRNR